MSYVPAGREGGKQVIDVGPTTDTEEQAAPPTSTVAPGKKPVPVIERVVPPPKAPDEGEIVKTVGGAR